MTAGAAGALSGAGTDQASLPVPDLARHGGVTPIADARGTTRGERLLLVLLAIGLTGAMLWRWPVFSHESFQSTNSLVDLSFYTYAGELLRTGGTPYITFWDHKPPLIYLLHAAGLTLSGGRVWGVWLVSVASVLLALWLAHRTLRRAVGATGALLGIVYFAASVPSIFSVGLTEWYILPISWATALVFVRDDVRVRPMLPFGVLMGVFAVLGALLKPNMIGAPVAASLVAAGLLLADRRWSSFARLVIGGVAGVVLTLLPVLAWLAAIGALDAFREQVLAYNSAYVATGPSWKHRVRALDAGLMWATLYSSLVIPALGWLAGAWRVARGPRDGARDPQRPVLLLALVWLPVELVLAATSGRDYSHYFTTLYPPLALLVALVGVELARQLPVRDVREARLRPTLPLVPLLALVLAGHGAWKMFWRERDDIRSVTRAKQIDAVVDYVRRTVPAGAPIFVWGHAVDVYMLSGHPPATPYVYVQPLLTPGFADSARVHAFVTRLASRAPAIIVDAGARMRSQTLVDGSDLTPPLGAFPASWSYPKVTQPWWKGPSWWSMPAPMRAFYDYVASAYAPVDTVGPQRWVIYRPRTRGT